MRTIHKFPLSPTTFLHLPLGAKPLCVQMQAGWPKMWVQLETDGPLETRRFDMIGTGNPMPPAPCEYIDTVQMEDGQLVFHIFEFIAPR